MNTAAKARAKAKAIQTKYKGYKFRSRIEARWAVYFDEMGIEYLYEPEGYVLSDGHTYLPDFYLPEYDCYAECKGGPLDSFDYGRAKQLVLDSGIPLIMLDKYPRFDVYTTICVDSQNPSKVEFTDVNLCKHPKEPKKGEFLENVFLVEEEMFKRHGMTNVINAVKSARRHRFGT